MKVGRRTVLKGITVGGIIAAVGLPRWSLATPMVEPKSTVLVMGGTAADAAFIEGARSVAGDSEVNDFEFAAICSAGMPDPSRTQAFIDGHRGERLIGLIDDGSYVIFSELMRDAGASFIFEGRHGFDNSVGGASRHVLQSVAGFHGAGESLAAGLSAHGGSFIVTEQPLGASSRPLRGGDWSSLGFHSYKTSGDEEALWLHLADISIEAACNAMGVQSSQAERLRCWKSYPPAVAEGDWPHLLGRALLDFSQKSVPNRFPFVAQAFIRGEKALSSTQGESMVSFVMDL